MIEIEKVVGRCFKVSTKDNVATLLETTDGGELTVHGQMAEESVCALEQIALGHKVALRDVRREEPIIKYGVPIAIASKNIAKGAWVHIHNCRSQVDVRSNLVAIELPNANESCHD
jgi:altronate dehydratase small subunit